MNGGELPDSIRVVLGFDPDFDIFLPPGSRGVPIEKKPGHATTIKDLIESCGVPHTEIGYLVHNGSVTASFSTHISDGDHIDILPVMPPRPDMLLLQPVPPVNSGFIADIHLGKTARRLRLLGFDTVWFTGRDDAEMLDIMEADGRILLTRDRRLLMNNRVVFGCCVRSDRMAEQVRQVVDRFGLSGRVQPFSRCIACNGVLEPRSKETVNALLQPKTRRYYEEFQGCPSCGKIYWQGSHTLRLQAFVDEILQGGGHSVL
jgi:hypothetical protein